MRTRLVLTRPLTTRQCPSRAALAGVTIIELSLTISVLLMMAGIAIYSVGGYHEWRLGREAATRLRSVYLAQKFLLADHPTFQVADVTGGDLLPYLPGNASAIPTVEALDGTTKSVDFNVMPPVVAGNYDPSGSPDDGVWDVGKR